jgi:hypothetical protein
LKKEISFRRKRKDEGAGPVVKEPKAQRRQRKASAGHKRTKRVVGLKIGGSQLAAARVVNNGVPELIQVAREPLEGGIIVGGELREPELLADALRAFFRSTSFRARASASGSPTTASASASSRSRGSTTRSSWRTRSATAPRRRSRSRSRRRCSTSTFSASASTTRASASGACCSSSPTAS